MSSGAGTRSIEKEVGSAFFSWLGVLLCVLFLSSCGDFSSIFEKGQARHTGKHKAPSAHEKGKQTVAVKARGKKGRVLTGMFIWPIDGEISSPFGERGGHPHDGIDIRAEKGTPVHAAADGEVAFSGNLGGYGNLVLLKHRDNYFTAYAHTEENLVKEGKRVEQGDVIAKVGNTGHATGYHLHFEIRYESTPMDPIAFLPSEAPSTLVGKREVREAPAPQVAVKNDPAPIERFETKEEAPPDPPAKEIPPEEPKLPIPYDL